MDWGAWQAIVHGVSQNWTGLNRLSNPQTKRETYKADRNWGVLGILGVTGRDPYLLTQPSRLLRSSHPQVSISTYLDGQNNPTSTPPPSTHTLVSLPPAPFTLHSSWDKWASWTWNLPSHPDGSPRSCTSPASILPPPSPAPQASVTPDGDPSWVPGILFLPVCLFANNYLPFQIQPKSPFHRGAFWGLHRHLGPLRISALFSSWGLRPQARSSLVVKPMSKNPFFWECPSGLAAAKWADTKEVVEGQWGTGGHPQAPPHTLPHPRIRNAGCCGAAK